MPHSVSLRLMLPAALAVCSLAGVTAAAQTGTSGSTGAAVPAAPAPGTQKDTSPNGSSQTPLPSGSGAAVLQTPAQLKYGLPKNPSVGGKVDTDITKPLSLDRAVQIGLQRQNSISISRYQADANVARLRQSYSSYYPQATPSYQYNYTMQPGGGFFVGGNLIRGSNISETTTELIRAQLLILDSGQREASIGQSRRNAYSSLYALGNERQNVILNVTESYYTVLRNKELVRVEQENVTRAQTTLESIQAQVSVGNAAKTDTFQAESDLANAQVALLQAQSDYDVSQATLKNAMGVISSQPLKLTEDRAATPDLTPDPLGLERYVRASYQERLDVKQQQERVNAQGYALRLARINAGLQVSANVSEGYQAKPYEGEVRALSFNVSFPLFDGFSTREAIRENQALLESERRTLDQVQQNVRLNVEQSYLVREQSRFKISAANKAVQAGQVNYDAALERQRNGLINILDVLNAQVQLINAQVAQVQAIYDYYIAEARLLRSVGLNDPLYIPPIPGAKASGTVSKLNATEAAPTAQTSGAKNNASPGNDPKKP